MATEPWRTDVAMLLSSASDTIIVCSSGGHYHTSSRDETAWAEPDRFLPKRFLAGEGGNVVNLGRKRTERSKCTGGRTCPGMGVAMLHLGYFVRELEWTGAEGNLAVDLEPKIRLLNIMKRPHCVLR
ncbi:hypothetical protein ZWY2020_050108 [Hordeum vulgare]|nr:hypothetical protein ZWY2020_050108 [Hordeum vulgare]